MKCDASWSLRNVLDSSFRYALVTMTGSPARYEGLGRAADLGCGLGFPLPRRGRIPRGRGRGISENGGAMEWLQKPLGAYLVGIAVVVAVWFIINN